MTLRRGWLLIGWGKRHCFGYFIWHLIWNGRLLRNCVYSFWTGKMHHNILPGLYHWHWTCLLPPLGMRHNRGICWPISLCFRLGDSFHRRWRLRLGKLCCRFLLRKKGRWLLITWNFVYPPLKVGGNYQWPWHIVSLLHNLVGQTVGLIL